MLPVMAATSAQTQYHFSHFFWLTAEGRLCSQETRLHYPHSEQKDMHCSRNDTFKSGRGYLLLRKSEEQSARPWWPFILPNHQLRADCFQISAFMTAKRPSPLAGHVTLNVKKQINYPLCFRLRWCVFLWEMSYCNCACVNVSVVACGLLFHAQTCSHLWWTSWTDNLPKLWHGCSSSWEEVRINNGISPGCDFIHYLSSNWLLQVGFLTCPTINVLLFMCLINGHCSFMKNTHSITSGIKKPWQFVLYCCAGDGRETLISQNGIQ